MQNLLHDYISKYIPLTEEEKKALISLNLLHFFNIRLHQPNPI